MTPPTPSTKRKKLENIAVVVSKYRLQVEMLMSPEMMKEENAELIGKMVIEAYEKTCLDDNIFPVIYDHET